MNFDQEFRGGLAIRSAKPCSYRVPASAVINISHGVRAAKGKGGGSSASSNGRGQSATTSSGASTGGGGGRNTSPRKPTAVVPPLDPGCEQAAGQPMPGTTPPDPKNLPNPMLLFAKKGDKPSNRAANNPTAPPGPPRAQAAGPTGEPVVMQNLWKSLENSTKTQPEVKVLRRQPPPPVPSEEAMSRDLNSMLNIRPPAAAGGESSVEAFFAAAASSGVKPPPPMPPPPQQKADADSSFCRRLIGMLESHECGQPRYTFAQGEEGRPVATVVMPWGEKYEGSEERDRDSAAESAAQLAVGAFEEKGPPPPPKQQSTAFVPMQVARKIVRTKSASEKKKEKKAALKLGGDEGGGGGPDRVAEWVIASQPPPPKDGAGAGAAQREQPPPPPVSGRGRGRGGRGRGHEGRPGQAGATQSHGAGRGQRKPRLAANFGGPPASS